MEENVLRRGVAEFVGAFTLIFIGGGAGIVSGGDIVAVALANGLAIGIMVTNLGHISGGHFNPAITLGFVATRRITLRLAVAYWISQFAGAIAAAAILRGLFSHADFLGAVPHAAGFGAGKGLVVELILTFFLVWAVFATAVDPRGAFKSIAGLAIGFTIALDVYLGFAPPISCDQLQVNVTVATRQRSFTLSQRRGQAGMSNAEYSHTAS